MAHTHTHTPTLHISCLYRTPTLRGVAFAWRPGNRTTQLSMHNAHEISFAISSLSLLQQSLSILTPIFPSFSLSLSLSITHLCLFPLLSLRLSLWGISMHVAVERQIKIPAKLLEKLYNIKRDIYI